MQSPPGPQSNYRPDIDRLRAIAVLAVVAYHAFPAAAPGGFVGVDVFFVISGFLITGVILEGVQTGSFSYVDFYARRIKRIFPALLLVLIACMAFGWLSLLPDEFRALGKYVFAGAGFWTNFTLWRESGYFDVSSLYKPLLHLWSLAIEEQFYLLWPFIAVWACMLGKRVLAAALLIIAISLTIDLVEIKTNPVATFYLPLSRAWELLAGACLARIPMLQLAPRSSAVREIASAVGLALIIIPIATFAPDAEFPGWRALLPVAGSLLVIAAGSAAWTNRILLAHPAPVAVGLISYPLYLWHWPALSFPEILGLASPFIKPAALASSFALAWLTYRFVELPVRRSSDATSIWLIGLMISVGAVGLLAKRSVINAKSASPQIEKIVSARSDWQSPPDSSTPVSFEGQTFWRDGASPKIALIIGDSDAEQYFARTHELIRNGRADLSTIYAFKGACLPLPGITNREVANCDNLISAAFNFARKPEVETVVVTAQWLYLESGRYDFHLNETAIPADRPPGRGAAFLALQNQLRELRGLGKRTIVILNIPVGKRFAPTEWIVRSISGVSIYQPTVSRSEAATPAYSAIMADLVQAAEKSGSDIIDPFNALCPIVCKTSDENGAPIYKDANHLKSSFVQRNAVFVDKVLKRQDAD
jgi:peptidoglycan/LPS O-acetylase OafA/YrhL